MSKETVLYPHVIPNIEDWPIYKIHQDRDSFVKEIQDFTLSNFTRKPTSQVSDIIAQAIYQERIRIKEEPWRVDPPNESIFWKKIRKKLVRQSLDKNEEQAKEVNEEILKQIIGRYSEEIVGSFKKSTFLFARKFLMLFFNRLLNTAAGRNLGRFYSTKHRVKERFKIHGDIESIRSLMTKGTVVLVPTHFSNLDSILIGYAMDSILGLPSFTYGAGLNLYNTGYTAYFMKRLGLYTVDRRKKNAIYLETLKGVCNLSIRRGLNNLFFPGGTRSRSGALETKLKMGLIGTAVQAQCALYEKGKENKIFVVPLILGYHTVLEAEYLIKQHLKKTGKELYHDIQDQTYSRWNVFKFVWKLFSQSSDIVLSFGKPMDVLGNFVDSDGTSYDRHDKTVDVKEYFMSDGRIRSDLQRERQYTTMLANRIVERFHKENIVLSSHMMAFVVFTILVKQNPNLDLYGVLRLPSEDYIFKYEHVKTAVVRLREELIKMEENGRIKLSDEVRVDVDELIKGGISKLGIFHPQKPLKINKNGDIESESFPTLYYYHNRLSTYDLKSFVKWSHSVAMLSFADLPE